MIHKTANYHLAIILIALVFLTALSCTDNRKDSEAISVSLIDGTQDRWQTKGQIQFDITDEVLELTGAESGGWAFYREEFEDFELKGEFKLDEGQVGGIAFRVPEVLIGNPASVGYKIILDHNMDQQNPMGSIFQVARAKGLKSTEVNDWTSFFIKAEGDHLQVMINDTLVAETHNRRSEEGLIGFYAAGNSKLQLRSVKANELEEQEMDFPLVEDYMRSDTERSFVPLITENGLDDWRPIGKASWDLKDGVIHGYSNEEGGFLAHHALYHNFYLKLKFKIIHEDNSGIFIRHNPDEPDVVTVQNAIECNIYDHDGYLHEYSTGSIAPIARAWSKLIDYSDWNQMEIFAFEDQICMYVNGIKSSEAHLPQSFNRAGEICIQGGIQVFNNNLPSDIYVKDMLVKDFGDAQFIGQ